MSGKLGSPISPSALADDDCVAAASATAGFLMAGSRGGGAPSSEAISSGEFVLGSTIERVRLPDDLVARLEGKSSLGRLGLLIHSTAGYVDPGWDGFLTLELSNVANLPITIYPHMKIGQISFFRLSTPAEVPYGSKGTRSKYQGQRGPTASRFFEEFERGDRG